MRPRYVVVGAGLAGASAAALLAPHGEVWWFEQGEPGAEATAQNAGMFRTLGRDAVEIDLAVRSRALWARQPEVFGAELLRPTGGLVVLAKDDPEVARRAALVAQRGVEIAAVEGPALRSLAPVLAGSGVERGYWVESDGLVDVHGLLWALIREAQRHGARLQGHLPVEALLTDGVAVTGVQAGGQHIHADATILAGGAWSGPLAARAGVLRPHRPLARHLLQSEPQALSTPGHPWTWIDDVGLYVRPEAGGWLCSPCDEALQDAPIGPGSRGPLRPEAAALADQKLSQWLPALSGLRWRSGWQGLRTFAPDRHPYIGPEPGRPGLFWLSALGGHGVTGATAAGELLRDLVLGRSVDWVDVGAVDPGRVL